MPNRLVVVPLLLAAGCSYPQHVASKVVELSIPAAGLTDLACESHNGRLSVVGDAAVTQVELRAELSVRGYSQGEADANLHLLEIGRETTGGRLRIFGKYPPDQLNNRSPSFAFSLKVPQGLAVQLESHNGDLVVRGVDGQMKLTTHNGSIEGSATTKRVEAVTHNGDVHLELAGEGSLDGTIESHNGTVVVGLGKGRGAMLAASTHNGDIDLTAEAADVQMSKRSLRARIGDGSGRLTVTTHNGDVHLR